MKKIALLFTTVILITVSVSIAQQVYFPIDAGSKVHFVIKNFGINTGGDFTGLKGSIRFDPANFTNSSFDVSVDANTVNTDNKSRDNHLRKEEYFNVAAYPTLQFKSVKVFNSKVTGVWFLDGTITIKGVSKLISFPFTYLEKDSGYLFEGSFELNRKDFGVGGNSAVMGDNVKVTLSIFAKK